MHDGCRKFYPIEFERTLVFSGLCSSHTPLASKFQFLGVELGADHRRGSFRAEVSSKNPNTLLNPVDTTP